MKNLEVRMAFVLGIALPLLETLRRRANFSPFAMYVDDYFAGIILLVAAVAVTRGKAWGPAVLVGAWGIVVGGMYGSFFSQVHNAASHDISGLPNWTVVVIKGIVLALATVCFVRSIPRASRSGIVERDPGRA